MAVMFLQKEKWLPSGIIAKGRDPAYENKFYGFYVLWLLYEIKEYVTIYKDIHIPKVKSRAAILNSYWLFWNVLSFERKCTLLAHNLLNSCGRWYSVGWLITISFKLRNKNRFFFRNTGKESEVIYINYGFSFVVAVKYLRRWKWVIILDWKDSW
jgi:hypothetical protein